MDENPYKTRESDPEIERPLPKPPSRHVVVPLCAVLAFVGLFSLLGLVVTFTDPAYAERRDVLRVLLTLIVSTVCVTIAWWAWRNPESKSAPSVALLVAVSVPFVWGLADILFLWRE